MKATAVLFSTLYVLASSSTAELQDCSTPCACQARAEAIARHIKNKLDSATQTAADNAQQALKLTAAASVADRETAKFLAPVTAIALATIANDAAALKDATPTITKAIETFTAAAAHYSLVTTLTGEVQAADLDASGNSHYGDANVAAATITPKVENTCPGAKDERQISAEAAQFPPDLKFKQTDLHMAIHITCAKGSGDASDGAIVGNKIKTKASFSTSAISKNNGALSNGAFKPIATGTLLTQETTPQTLNAGSKSIQEAVTKLEQIKPLTDSDIFTANTKLREYVKTQIYNLQPADKEQQAVATQITEHIPANYGAGSAGFTDKIWKAAKGIPLEYLTARQIERKKLEIVTDIDDLATAVALALSKEETKPEKPCETETIAKKHKDDCSTITGKTQ
uniref:Variant surface glycoprotein 1451 n=1 Tax=Trypanosoma brucei TaxID=5691 RepID=M4SYI3_9TRYP|nr:variant surface glycoprotein 1451 [Trypanosoma brucei]